MPRGHHRLLWPALLAAAVSSAWVSAAPAAAFTLTLSGPPGGVVGRPLVIQAGGNDPTDQGALYLEVDEISAAVATSCPPSYLSGSQLATSTGGRLVAFDQRENLDAAGNFSIPVGYTPNAAGAQLLCGYTDDGATDTLATATLSLTITATPALARPANTAKPRVTRSGRTLTCNRGRWSGSPTAFRYGWLVNGHARHGATSKHLAATHAFRNKRVQCRVTGVNAAGASAPAISTSYRVR
jgi:hypothetical protein